MSDFTSAFWPYFISAIVIGGIVFCMALLLLTSKSHDAAHTGESTGHVYDEDIIEMNNPMPKWWMWMFVITCVFGVVYLILYPGLGTWSGKLGWTQVKQYQQEVKESNERIAPIYAKYAGMPAEEVAKDAKAMAIGERLFMNNCSQCHGSDAQGSRGFPNLTDKDWLYGGAPETIAQTITHGRNGMMPPMAAAVGNADDVKNVAHYVLSLSDSQHDTNRAALGKEKFAACAACHGVDGKGNTAIGAPNLSDDIWLHGAGEAAIIERINHGKNNQMPAQGSRFTPEQIHVLAAYVWRFSNGEAAK
ncbi:MAG: cytochrome-c oxidase, cbb3-type subunit III [Methylotenera sp. 24-45-7]|jgi:cytochrome c oxidase cbb3-type subunit 3|nr:MAG: cytochrome-c oxidase, cbb3-type subunit III [Mehylophilales bacterium 35-46-6]OYZ41455.1 MAG: cytochrome-c oxidase, cbb3-type subunit III [Methylotenera sp. 24-45-7]OZA09142.1 MAG: cytochrome-c oxidase, cbb3-type subunit III [Methylotenera sp. 17-45-7]OZA53223.1 MAG: cytochrome-c oxidase, cbb3-type subunit III [Methylophilales bacterium 39-45-7]HQS37455.1 cytochrome-c oxidase, cbb3-type subunit III [Methylotenera sp.]